MILNLDHNQRLHLVAALDGYESHGRREGFTVCRLQEKLDLNEEERMIIGWRKMKADEREFAVWSNSNGLPVREYDLSDIEIKCICAAIDKYPVVLGRDKGWWVPLTMQLPDLPEATERQAIKVVDAVGSQN